MTSSSKATNSFKGTFGLRIATVGLIIRTLPYAKFFDIQVKLNSIASSTYYTAYRLFGK